VQVNKCRENGAGEQVQRVERDKSVYSIDLNQLLHGIRALTCEPYMMVESLTRTPLVVRVHMQEATRQQLVIV
jgi:hypothetical protein